GPSTTEPSATANLLPWQLQLIVPPVTSVTGQPWWVQVPPKARNFPAVGCVITMSWSANTAPPPTGISDVRASALAGAAPPPLVGAPCACGAAGAPDAGAGAE